MLSEREEYLVKIILYYRNRGLGYWRIGRILFPNLSPRAAQMRVLRLIKRYKKYINRESTLTRDNNNGTRSRRQDKEPEDDNVSPVPKLGRTQRLVIAALKSLGGRARFSAINREVAEMIGISPEVTRRRVWAALNRLKSRGVVDSLGGVYWLTRRAKGPSGVLVENFRVRRLDGVVQIWAKSRHGRPASLDEALEIATLRGAQTTVQVELSTGLPRWFSRLMGHLGISIIKIYRDPGPPWRGRAKIEVSYDHPPLLRPHIAEREHWIRVLLGTLRDLVRAMFAGGLVGALHS